MIHLHTTYSALTGANAEVYQTGSGFTVFFGWFDGGRFQHSHSTPSRQYKTFDGAKRAAQRWIQ